LITTNEGGGYQNYNKTIFLFCHFFQAYSTPDEYWVFDETISTISSYIQPLPPLNSTRMIVPDDGDTANNISHWDRPLTK